MAGPIQPAAISIEAALVGAEWQNFAASVSSVLERTIAPARIASHRLGHAIARGLTRIRLSGLMAGGRIRTTGEALSPIREPPPTLPNALRFRPSSYDVFQQDKVLRRI